MFGRTTMVIKPQPLSLLWVFGRSSGKVSQLTKWGQSNKFLCELILSVHFKCQVICACACVWSCFCEPQRGHQLKNMLVSLKKKNLSSGSIQSFNIGSMSVALSPHMALSSALLEKSPQMRNALAVQTTLCSANLSKWSSPMSSLAPHDWTFGLGLKTKHQWHLCWALPALSGSLQALFATLKPAGLLTVCK